MAAARNVAVDIFFADYLLATIDRFERSSVHSANCCAAMALDQRGRGQLHSGEDHAAVSGTGAPSESFGFECGDFHAAFRECARGGKAAETAADNDNVAVLRHIAW